MRQISDSEIQHYQEFGVVYLPDLLDDDWLRRMEIAFTEEMFGSREDINQLDIGVSANALKEAGIDLVSPGSAQAAGRFWIKSFNWRKFPAIGELGCKSPLPQEIARLMGSTRINFYGDQAFFKEAGSKHRTAFHQDAPYFHLSGEQCCTVWMPLDVVDADNGMMGYIKGSHRWRIHAANMFASRQPIPGSTAEQLPDIERHEEEYDIVYYPAKPGDAIVHHVRTVHGSTGNTCDRDRRALALRYVGDDVRYLERAGSPPDSQKSDGLKDGDRMDSPEFPLIWTAENGYTAI